MLSKLMLIVAGGLFLWLEMRGLLTGRMWYKSFTTERKTSPVSFWLQAVAYAVIGLGFIGVGIGAVIREWSL